MNAQLSEQTEVRVILATGDQKLDQYLRTRKGLTVTAEVYYREALVDAIRRAQAEVALVSAYLPGEVDLADVLYKVRAVGIRVIFLAGDLKPDDPLLLDLLAIGIYDLFFNPVQVEEIEERFRCPAHFHEALRRLRAPGRPSGGRLWRMFRRNPVDSPAALQVPANASNVPSVGSDSISPTFPANDFPPATAPAQGNRRGGLSRLLSRLKPLRPRPAGKLQIVRREDLRVRVWLVAGTAPRVGSTTVALALGEFLRQQGKDVVVADAGGGAASWVNGQTELKVVNVDPIFAAAPGTITVVDVGVSGNPDLLAPLAEALLVVTAGGRDLLKLSELDYGPASRWLVFNRYAGDALRAVEEIPGFAFGCALPAANQVAGAEHLGRPPLPVAWQRPLSKLSSRILGGP